MEQILLKQDPHLQYTATRERAESQSRMQSSPVADYGAPNSELEAARPQTAGEEELQLQLALAMSREEAEQEENKTKSDDMRLQLALQKSKEEAGSDGGDGFTPLRTASSNNPNSRPSNDLLDLDFGNPVAQPSPPQRTAASASTASAAVDPWGMPAQPPAQPPAQMDPWGGSNEAASAAAAVPSALAASNNDPWSPVKEPRASPNLQAAAAKNDPWSPAPDASQVLGNDAWGAASAGPPTDLPQAIGGGGGQNELSIDPFSPVAQKELTEFDLLRNEIEGAKSNNGGKIGLFLRSVM